MPIRCDVVSWSRRLLLFVPSTKCRECSVQRPALCIQRTLNKFYFLDKFRRAIDIATVCWRLFANVVQESSRGAWEWPGHVATGFISGSTNASFTTHFMAFALKLPRRLKKLLRQSYLWSVSGRHRNKQIIANVKEIPRYTKFCVTISGLSRSHWRRVWCKGAHLHPSGFTYLGGKHTENTNK
ncbi:hypothetical protein EVAR_2883_1 [Eumeta japonica]|uniref:Uncharacterized protein n=1 Tax=Eumeta variegata TaxID=151549 RepID=A0A4C1T3P7_EUMVA|nr:hypothetical protein EVAR_2883_1 [Eumeta japonica]